MATSKGNRVVLLVLGGPLPRLPARLLHPLQAVDTTVIAVDGGLDNALDLGFKVNLVVGDLDSVSEGALARARKAGVAVEAFRPDKDWSDLELALQQGVARDATDIVVVGSQAGRFDHVLANVAVLTGSALHHVRVSAIFDDTRLTVVPPGAERMVEGNPGQVVSVFAIGGDARGVTISNARWPLHDARLASGSAWGLSNEFVTDGGAGEGAVTVGISCASGVLVVVQPGPESS